MIMAAMMPGIHPTSVRTVTMRSEPQPLSSTAAGGNRMQTMARSTPMGISGLGIVETASWYQRFRRARCPPHYPSGEDLTLNVSGAGILPVKALLDDLSKLSTATATLAR